MDTRMLIGQDLRFAVRQIARTPLFSGVMIAVIALGIGINAGLMTLLDTYAWHPAPGIAPDSRLARLRVTAQASSNREVKLDLSYPDILGLRERRDLFTDVGAWTLSNLAVDLSGGAEQVRVNYATGNYFRVLGVSMAAGAPFMDDVDRSPLPVAVIDHSLWLANFGGSPDVVGKTIRVMNVPVTIVGVAPPLFSGVDVNAMGQPAIWMPLSARGLVEPGDRARRDDAPLEAFARLAPRLSFADVAARAGGMDARLTSDARRSLRRITPHAARLSGLDQQDGGTKELIAAFLIVGVLVIVITCTNVSALLLGRAVARRHEIGVRLSLGATRLRLIRQLLTESLVYAAVGTLLALGLYAASMKIAYAMAPELIPGLEPRPATFAFAAVFALATTIIFGLAPALTATRADLAQVMKSSATQSIGRARLQTAFVVVQLACSQPVLVVTSLVLANARAASSDADAPASVVTMETDLLRPGLSDGESRAVATSIARRLAELEGVRSVSLNTGAQRASFSLPSSPTTEIQQMRVSADFLATRGIPLVRGRAIGVDEDRRGSTVAVVNEAAARLLWPNADPVGQRLVRRARDTTETTTTLDVIGVAGAAPYDREQQAPQIYVPIATAPSVRWPIIAVRTMGDARAFVPRIRATIGEVEPYAAVDKVTTLAERYAGERREAVQANLAAFAVGAAALVLASLGLYAIIALAVAQRTREIGIRLAIGDTPAGIVRRFFRHGVAVSAAGLAIGLPVAVVAVQTIPATPLAVSLRNVIAVLTVVPILVLVAVLASWLPARRAARVDPLTALRSE